MPGRSGEGGQGTAGHPRGRKRPEGSHAAQPLIEKKTVPVAQLRWRCDPASLPFTTTRDVEPAADVIGQERAARALELGLQMEPAGFNLFVAGPTGTGRMSSVRTFVERLAPTRPRPDDLCYVWNFKDPSAPRAISLPAGD